MKKFGILLVVVLLGVSGVMAAMAYTTMELENLEGSLQVVSTEDALLALSPASDDEIGHKDGAAYIETWDEAKDRLEFDFTRGYEEGEEYGFQWGSKYTWEELFEVTNNSNDRIEVEINVPSYNEDDNLPHNTHTYLSVSGEDFEHWNENHVKFELEPGESEWIDFQFDYTRKHAGTEYRGQLFDVEFELDATAIE